jgi:hypothetical protein
VSKFVAGHLHRTHHTRCTRRNFWERLRQFDPGLKMLRVALNTVPNEKLKTQRVVACPLLARYWSVTCPLPPKSPDMHMVNEHVLNTVQKEFGKRLWLHPGKHNMSMCRAAL